MNVQLGFSKKTQYRQVERLDKTVFGGVLRDVVCNEIPNAFKDHKPYAICAFVGGWAYVGWWWVTGSAGQALIVCVAVTFGLRALALWRNRSFPTWKA